MLMVWRSVLDQTNTTYDVGELLVKAREEYRGMISLKTWAPHDRIPKKSKSNKDIAALLANAEAQKAQIKALTAAVRENKTGKRSNAAIRQNGFQGTRPTNKHDWKLQYGEDKDFDDKTSFMDWLHKAPTGSSKSVKKNDIWWYWCPKCLRWSSHKSTECTRTSKREKPTAFANVASRMTDARSDSNSESEMEWSDENIEVSHPRKKTRRSKKIKKSKN